MSEVKKSNAPWILGLIGFVLSIPQIICSILCAGATAAINEGVKSSGGGEAADSVSESLTMTTIVFLLPVICSLGSFILSFMGKSKISAITGILMIILGVTHAYACFTNISYLGIAAGVLFFCGGISSICNAKK